MPFERKLSVNFIDELRDEFGNNIDASHVKKFATARDVGYATVARKLKQFQVKRGSWNLTVEQACAQAKRELIRVNISIETDEDDLIGGFRLVDGNTVWHNGPVVEALERGAVLLLDEIDLASNKILCLQSILEGKGCLLYTSDAADE